MKHMNILLLVGLTGCAGNNVIGSQTLVWNTTIKTTSYDLVSECIYRRLVEAENSGVHKADLPAAKETSVYIDAGSMRIMTFRISQQGKDVFVDTSSVQTLAGTFPIDRQRSVIEPCLRPKMTAARIPTVEIPYG